MPAVAVVCITIGVVWILGGGLLIIGGFANSIEATATANTAGDTVAELQIAGGFATLLSSALWFAIARGLALLAQIERNTKK